MSLGRKLVDYAVPLAIAATAFLNARAIGSLTGAALAVPPLGPSIAEARPLAREATRRLDARAILDRNPFEHGAAPREPIEEAACEGVRPLVVVGADDPRVAFASLEVGGQRVLRRRGDEVADMRVAHVGRESVWLERDGHVCEARLFAPRAPAPPRSEGQKPPSESPLAGKVERVSPTELRVDRAAVDRLLEMQSELTRIRVAPEGRALRLVGIKPGSSLALLGLEDGDRLEAIDGAEIADTERVLAAYARLKSGNVDRLTVRLARRGRPLELDYVIR